MVNHKGEGDGGERKSGGERGQREQTRATHFYQRAILNKDCDLVRPHQVN